MIIDSSGGAEAMSGSGQQQCPTLGRANTFYLYDRGSPLATFDAAGNVVDMYVVGPGGNRIATYYLNSDSSLNYFMPDHLGSTRVVMKGVPPSSTYPYLVSAYYNYLPFGGTQEAVTNYSSPNQWTNHEHDQHGSFDYYNFGARLYDPKVGLFLTPDKAGQFTSGYVYGGNSPVMGVDPDGNMFWLLALAIKSAVLATFDVGVARLSGQTTDLGKMWINSFLMNTATGSLTKLNPVGQLKQAADNAKGFWGIALKGSYYAAQIGKAASTAVTTYNTYENIREGNWRGAYFDVRLRDYDNLVAEAAFFGQYWASPLWLTGSDRYAPTIGVVTSNVKGSHRAALAYKGGAAEIVTLPEDAFGVTWGHNIFIEGNRWKQASERERRQMLHHEFVHVRQFEADGPAFVGMYAYESMSPSIQEPKRKYTYPWYAWTFGGGNKYENDAYMEGFNYDSYTTTSYGFLPF